MNITLRWDSALPVQQALKRQGASNADEAKAVADASDKNYVVSVFGFRMPSNRRGSYNSGNDSDADQDRSRQSADNLRSQLLDAAQLVPRLVVRSTPRTSRWRAGVQRSTSFFRAIRPSPQAPKKWILSWKFTG